MKNKREIKRGDVFYTNLTYNVGSEQSGCRPVLIISNDTGNKHSRTVITAMITRRTDTKSEIPTHYCIKAQQGLKYDSIVLLEQLRTIDKTRLREYIGRLDENTMSEVDKVLKISVGLE